MSINVIFQLLSLAKAHHCFLRAITKWAIILKLKILVKKAIFKWKDSRSLLFLFNIILEKIRMSNVAGLVRRAIFNVAR